MVISATLWALWLVKDYTLLFGDDTDLCVCVVSVCSTCSERDPICEQHRPDICGK